MDLSSIAQVTPGIASVGTQTGGVGSQGAAVVRKDAANGANAATKALKRAASRANEQPESTKVQLSAGGQVKIALAELQTASKAVSEPKNTATADDARDTIQRFVASYNKANAAARANTSETSTEEARARRLEDSLRRSAEDTGHLAELNKAGLAQNKDGSLSLDAKAIEAALKEKPQQTVAAFAALGEQVEKATVRGLGAKDTSSVSEAFEQRSRKLEAERVVQQAQAEAQQSTQAQKTANVAQAASGIAAYQRNFLG